MNALCVSNVAGTLTRRNRLGIVHRSGLHHVAIYLPIVGLYVPEELFVILQSLACWDLEYVEHSLGELDYLIRGDLCPIYFPSARNLQKRCSPLVKETTGLAVQRSVHQDSYVVTSTTDIPKYVFCSPSIQYAV